MCVIGFGSSVVRSTHSPKHIGSDDGSYGINERPSRPIIHGARFSSFLLRRRRLRPLFLCCLYALPCLVASLSLSRISCANLWIVWIYNTCVLYIEYTHLLAEKALRALKKTISHLEFKSARPSFLTKRENKNILAHESYAGCNGRGSEKRQAEMYR